MRQIVGCRRSWAAVGLSVVLTVGAVLCRADSTTELTKQLTAELATQALNVELDAVDRALATGDVNVARQAWVRARILAQRSPTVDRIALSLTQSTFQTATGRWSEAEDTLTKLLKRPDLSSTERAAAWNNLGNVYRKQQRLQRAHDSYQRAYGTESAESGSSIALKARLNDTRILFLLGQPRDAREHVHAVIGLLDHLQDGPLKTYGLLSTAQLAGRLSVSTRKQSEPELRYRLLKTALQATDQPHSQTHRAAVQRALSQLYWDYGRVTEALRVARQALFSAQLREQTALSIQILGHIGRLQNSLNQRDAALQSYRDAVALLKGQSTSMLISDEDPSQLGRRTLLEEAVEELLFAESRPNTQRESEALLDEVRQLVELQRAQAISDYYGDDCVAELREQTRGVDAIDPKTLVIYPVALYDRLELIVTGDTIRRRVTVDVSRQALEHALHNLRNNAQFAAPALYRHSAYEVYQWIIQPLEALLAEIQPDTLIFVPNATLQMVPLSALHDGERYLVERFAIASTPGLTLTQSHTSRREKLRLLIGGVSEPVQGFSALPYIEDEVNALSAQYQSSVLLNQHFTQAGLVRKLSERSYPILHLASHGAFDPSAQESYVLSYDDRMGLDDIEELLTTGRYLDHPVSLLTLSACSTAAADERSALGLGGLAVKSGAQSVLASLWRVSDRASEILMQNFYRELSVPGTSMAQALQKAQVTMLAHPQYDAPFYWSPFVLVGNWQ